jgi:CBS domain-containing protein
MKSKKNATRPAAAPVRGADAWKVIDRHAAGEETMPSEWGEWDLVCDISVVTLPGLPGIVTARATRKGAGAGSHQVRYDLGVPVQVSTITLFTQVVRDAPVGSAILVRTDAQYLDIMIRGAGVLEEAKADRLRPGQAIRFQSLWRCAADEVDLRQVGLEYVDDVGAAPVDEYRVSENDLPENVEFGSVIHSAEIGYVGADGSPFTTAETIQVHCGRQMHRRYDLASHPLAVSEAERRQRALWVCAASWDELNDEMRRRVKAAPYAEDVLERAAAVGTAASRIGQGGSAGR